MSKQLLEPIPFHQTVQPVQVCVAAGLHRHERIHKSPAAPSASPPSDRLPKIHPQGITRSKFPAFGRKFNKPWRAGAERAAEERRTSAAPSFGGLPSDCGAML